MERSILRGRHFPAWVRAVPLLGVAVAFVAIAGRASGRIGDTKEVFEQRIFANGRGMRLMKDRWEERARRSPYANQREFLPEDHELVVYFKTADGSRPVAGDLREGELPPGWEVHVVYVAGRSFLELYRRQREDLADGELRGLLAANQGASFWKRVPPNEQEATVFGYNYELEEGGVRALHRGREVLFFTRSLDESAAGVVRARHERATRQREAGSAVSVEGF